MRAASLKTALHIEALRQILGRLLREAAMVQWSCHTEVERAYHVKEPLTVNTAGAGSLDKHFETETAAVLKDARSGA